MVIRLMLVILSFIVCNSANTQVQDSKEQSPDWDKMVDSTFDQLVYSNEFRFNRAEMEHMRWVAKASLFLRGRKPLSFEQDDIELLKKMSKKEVVELFLQENNFYNSLFDFSLYFTGFKADELINGEGELSQNIFDYSQAIDAVIAVSKGQSFDTLFQSQSLTYLPPLGEVDLSVSESLSLPKEFDQLTSDLARRRFLFDYAVKKSQDYQSLNDVDIKDIENEACTLYYGLYETFSFTLNEKSVLEKLGISTNLVEKAQSKFHDPNQPSAPFFFCFPVFENMKVHYKINENALEQFKSFVPATIPYFQELKRLSEKFDHENYQVKNVKEMIPLEAKIYGKQLYFQNSKISQHLQNSSTNMNRKRGAYILKRFFCDDLTPIDVEIPEGHTSGAHGSNPSCFACHYKLDPMAGFFKNFGYSFTDFADQEDIIFDDGFSQNRQVYQKQWLKPDSIDWNIGYIKSTKQDHLNIYGENIDDLFNILRDSNEVKRCMVKRLLQFSTDSNQLFDPGFIDNLTQTYIADQKKNSQVALKNLFKDVVLSKSFSEGNRVYSECYDFGSGISENRPPCEVAHIIETSCKKCHDTVYGLNSLDLSQWVMFPNGEFGFPHIDESTGKQFSPKATFKHMLERISTTDSKKRMPRGPDMDPVYRQILYKWLSEKVQ